MNSIQAVGKNIGTIVDRIADLFGYSEIVSLLGLGGESDLQRRLNRIAQRETGEIDMVFAKLKVDAWVDRRNVVASQSGNFIRYPILTSGKIAIATGIERDLSVLLTKLRGEVTPVKIKLPEQHIELPFPLEKRPLLWNDIDLDRVGRFEMVLGRDQSQMNPVTVTLDYKQKNVSHVLVSGTTGSGKTNELVEMILSLAYNTSPADCKIVIVDPKFSASIAPLAILPHVSLFQETDACLDAIASVKNEMDKRKRNPSKKRVFLFVEEFAELGMESGKGGTTSLVEPLKSVTGIGRELLVHVVACTQKATIDVVDTVLRSNLPLRLAGQVSTAEESKVATGVPGSGAELLPGDGAFLFVRRGKVQRIQGHYVPEDDIEGIAWAIAAKWNGIDPYEIEWVENQEVHALGAIDAYTAKVLAAFDVAEIFDDAGEPLRGIKSRIARLLFGESAVFGGGNVPIVNGVLSRIKESV